MSSNTIIQVSTNELTTLIQQCVTSAFQKTSKEVNTSSESEYLTRQEVAKLFKCKVHTVYKWTVQGKLKSYGIGSRVLYKAHEVNNALIEL